MSKLFDRPPFYFAIAIVSQLALDYYAPIRELMPLQWLSYSTFFFAAGALIGAFAIGRFREAKTTLEPKDEPDSLVTTGLYQYSRNPMYLGLVLMLIGLAWRLGSLGPWLIIPIFVILIQTRFIQYEEHKLERIFGDDFRQYRQKVRRWL